MTPTPPAKQANDSKMEMIGINDENYKFANEAQELCSRAEKAFIINNCMNIEAILQFHSKLKLPTCFSYPTNMQT